MNILHITLNVLFRSSTEDHYTSVPIHSPAHGVAVVAALGVHNIDDATIDRYHVELLGSNTNPNQQLMSFEEIKQALGFPKQAAVTYPVMHGDNITQFHDETFVWYDEAGLQAGVCYSLAQAIQERTKYFNSL